jgi:hypothetical protein
MGWGQASAREGDHPPEQSDGGPLSGRAAQTAESRAEAWGDPRRCLRGREGEHRPFPLNDTKPLVADETRQASGIEAGWRRRRFRGFVHESPVRSGRAGSDNAMDHTAHRL